MEIKYCTHCGSQLKPDDRFCPSCGNAIKIKSEQVPADRNILPETRNGIEPAPPAPEKKRTLLWVVIAAVCLAGVIGTVFFILNNNSKTDQKYSDTKAAVKTEETSSAVSKTETYETPKAEEKNTDIDAAEEGNTDIEAEEEAVSDESADEIQPVLYEDGDYSGEVNSEGKDSDGMMMPEMEDGELLYIGYGDLDNVGTTKMALVISEDGKSISKATIYIDDFDNAMGDANVPFSNMQITSDLMLELPVKDASIGQSTFKDIHFEGEWIYVQLDYVFQNFVLGSSGNSGEQIPLGETEIWLKKAG